MACHSQMWGADFNLAGRQAIEHSLTMGGLAERDPGGAQADADRGGAGAARGMVHGRCIHLLLT